MPYGYFADAENATFKEHGIVHGIPVDWWHTIEDTYYKPSKTALRHEKTYAFSTKKNDDGTQNLHQRWYKYNETVDGKPGTNTSEYLTFSPNFTLNVSDAQFDAPSVV